jgi:hypothetical protein
VLSAVLLILTAVFAFVVTKVLATQRAEDDQRFTYTKDVMTSISGDVKSLHLKLDTTLIPRLDAVYGQLSEASPSLTASGFLNVLKTLGYQASQVADNQNPMFFLGIAHEGVNISIFIGFNLTDPVIAFRSFAFATTELPERASLA